MKKFKVIFPFDVAQRQYSVGAELERADVSCWFPGDEAALDAKLGELLATCKIEDLTPAPAASTAPTKPAKASKAAEASADASTDAPTADKPADAAAPETPPAAPAAT